jgi:multidrug efflux pump subunit AcrB
MSNPTPSQAAAPAPTPALGLAGRIAQRFLTASITPLLAIVALLLGVFAVMVTPREEEPQIDVTMAQVFVPYPGASAAQVEQAVAAPAEQVFGRMAGVEHVTSLSRAGMALLTVQFKVGVSRTEAIVRLHDTAMAHRDWLPPGLGVGEPVIRPQGIDDVPIVTLTLHGRVAGVSDTDLVSGLDLERVAHALVPELQRVPGSRDVRVVGGPGRAVLIDMDTARMRAAQVTVDDIRRAVQATQAGGTVGQVIDANQAIQVSSSPFLRRADEVGELIVAVHDGHGVALKDVSTVHDGALPAQRTVSWATRGPQGQLIEREAVTLAITKKPGENAVDVARALLARVAELRNTVIPDAVEVSVTRNHGETANDKAKKLITKLLFATASVVALVFMALGRREALIVGLAVALTLTATLFASWAWGFTLNRVSLFALIFSIGILVDDAIVVVENIHRHMHLHPRKTLRQLIPAAVDEVGGPTILATFTVIAALLPMAFVSGLMGPYMSPIPINASMGMLISLAIAFVLTPWMAQRWLQHTPATTPVDADADARQGVQAHTPTGLSARLLPLFTRVFSSFIDPVRGHANRLRLWGVILLLIALALVLPVKQWVVLKMLPFDNKSEFQVVLDMPAGTPMESTLAVLQQMGSELARIPEVKDWQTYAGTAAPINFNGLVRQYGLRSGGNVGDIQVNLVGAHDRSLKSHIIATRVRPALVRIAQAHGGRVKVVEVPPGPPVLAPLVAEIYGPDAPSRLATTRAVRKVMDNTPGIVDVDSSDIAPQPELRLVVDRARAMRRGVAPAQIVSTLGAALQGEDLGYLHDASSTPVPLHLALPTSALQDSLTAQRLTVRRAANNASGSDGLVPLSDLLHSEMGEVEQPLWHKDGLPVNFVFADMAAQVDARGGLQGTDSPLYGLFAMRPQVLALKVPGGPITEHAVTAPSDPYRGVHLKWDGESQITYETFRDMGAAYGVGLVLIYLLVVAQFGSYRTPLIIMAPIPLTLIGVMPGHALLGAPFTATSMIGMIALAGIIVRNSILLVDFIELQVREGMGLGQAVIQSAATRAQPIVLTALAAMAGAFFILDDPIFNGLAISLIFGIFVSSVLTLVVIPLLYFRTYRHRHGA